MVSVGIVHVVIVGRRVSRQWHSSCTHDRALLWAFDSLRGFVLLHGVLRTGATRTMRLVLAGQRRFNVQIYFWRKGHFFPSQSVSHMFTKVVLGLSLVLIFGRHRLSV